MCRPILRICLPTSLLLELLEPIATLPGGKPDCQTSCAPKALGLPPGRRPGVFCRPDGPSLSKFKLVLPAFDGLVGLMTCSSRSMDPREALPNSVPHIKDASSGQNLKLAQLGLLHHRGGCCFDHALKLAKIVRGDHQLVEILEESIAVLVGETVWINSMVRRIC